MQQEVTQIVLNCLHHAAASAASVITPVRFIISFCLQAYFMSFCYLFDLVICLRHCTS